MSAAVASFSPLAGENRVGLVLQRLATLREGDGALRRARQRRAHPLPTPTRQQAAKSSYPSPVKGEGKQEQT